MTSVRRDGRMQYRNRQGPKLPRSKPLISNFKASSSLLISAQPVSKGSGGICMSMSISCHGSLWRKSTKADRLQNPKHMGIRSATSRTSRAVDITRSCLEGAKKQSLGSYDFRKTAERVNCLSNYTAQIEDGRSDFTVRSAAVFSKKADAIPLLSSHGWPDSFLEFLG